MIDTIEDIVRGAPNTRRAILALMAACPPLSRRGASRKRTLDEGVVVLEGKRKRTSLSLHGRRREKEEEEEDPIEDDEEEDDASWKMPRLRSESALIGSRVASTSSSSSSVSVAAAPTTTTSPYFTRPSAPDVSVDMVLAVNSDDDEERDIQRAIRLSLLPVIAASGDAAPAPTHDREGEVSGFSQALVEDTPTVARKTPEFSKTVLCRMCCESEDDLQEEIMPLLGAGSGCTHLVCDECLKKMVRALWVGFG